MANKTNHKHYEKRSLIKRLVPKFISDRTDTEVSEIIKFMKFCGTETKPTDKVLDAGAGSCPYTEYFNHTNYESTDFEYVFDKSSKHKHNFVCSLDNIPKDNDSYDVVINTQVLEHVEYPQKVVNELYRILKPGGKLFLTAPQGWGVHGAPYHFFNFTKFGLESLFKNAGFKIVFIKPRGGMFWYLGRRIKTIPSYIFTQHMYKKDNGVSKFKPTMLGMLLLPFYLAFVPLCTTIIPFIFYYLDKLDKTQDYTLGYSCYCLKSKS